MRAFVPHLATLVIFLSAGWLAPVPALAGPAQVEKGFECGVKKFGFFVPGCFDPVGAGTGVMVTNKAGNELLQCQLTLADGQEPERAEVLDFISGVGFCVDGPVNAPTSCRLVKRPSGNATLICRDNPSTDPA
jgi:hypothetical protein